MKIRQASLQLCTENTNVFPVKHAAYIRGKNLFLRGIRVQTKVIYGKGLLCRYTRIFSHN